MPVDARLLELQWLTEFEQGKPRKLPDPYADTPEARLGDYLSRRKFVTNMWTKDGSLRITHEGAVRRAELEQELKSGRMKEPMGVVWDGRHFHQDTRIALLDATREHPLAVVYLDLNDVRVFNAKGHAAGDDAIRRYLEVVADVCFGRGDAYRLSGGADEVVILLPHLAHELALVFARGLLLALGSEEVHELTLRAAAGVVIATDPAEPVSAVKDRADAEQLRAKIVSRAGEGRPSVLAWPGAEPELIRRRP